jgi:hypothetical protein
MIAFFNSQIGEFQIYERPQPGQEDYGIMYSEDETVIMKTTVGRLAMEFFNNKFISYPIGFYKQVILSGNKYEKMSEIVSEVTGMPEKELKQLVENYLSTVSLYTGSITITTPESLTYERFLKLMKQADKLIGGGSNYSKTFMKSNARVPKTYETALAEYEEIIQKDQVSGAYARLFCDYMGIILAILPVFLAVTRHLRDRRAKISEVFYSRSISSAAVILSRYLSMLAMLLLPVLLLSISPTIQCIVYGNSIHASVDQLAFLKYIFGWLMPTIMVSISVGVFFTEITETAIAILIQGIWWFVSIFTGAVNINGGYDWNFVPRHNTLGDYATYIDNFHILAINRIAYTIIAILLILASIYVYDKKRRGELIARGKILPNRKSKSKI